MRMRKTQTTTKTISTSTTTTKGKIIMLKGKLMKKMKEKFGGNFTKTDGRWYWSNGGDNTLVTTSWLLKKLDEKTDTTTIKEEPKAFNVVPPKIEVEAEVKTATDTTTQEATKQVKKISKKKKEVDTV